MTQQEIEHIVSLIQQVVQKELSTKTDEQKKEIAMGTFAQRYMANISGDTSLPQSIFRIFLRLYFAQLNLVLDDNGKIPEKYIPDIFKNQKPTELELTYPSSVLWSNNNSRIIAKLLPLEAQQDTIFISDNKSINVYPNGEIKVTGAGDSVIHVIPIWNTELSKTIIISVDAPTLRLSGSSIRLTSDGLARY